MKVLDNLIWYASKMHTFIFCRVEVEHIKKKLDWKENHIADLVQENTALRSSLTRKSISNVTLPKLPASKSRDSPTKSIGSPDSIQEMDKVYKQFDKYVFLVSRLQFFRNASSSKA